MTEESQETEHIRSPHTCTACHTMAQKVIDTHIHLAKDWQNGETGLPNGWLPSEGASFHRNWTEVTAPAAPVRVAI